MTDHTDDKDAKQRADKEAHYRAAWVMEYRKVRPDLPPIPVRMIFRDPQPEGKDE